MKQKNNIKIFLLCFPEKYWYQAIQDDALAL